MSLGLWDKILTGTKHGRKLGLYLSLKFEQPKLSQSKDLIKARASERKLKLASVINDQARTTSQWPLAGF